MPSVHSSISLLYFPPVLAHRVAWSSCLSMGITHSFYFSQALYDQLQLELELKMLLAGRPIICPDDSSSCVNHCPWNGQFADEEALFATSYSFGVNHLLNIC